MEGLQYASALYLNIGYYTIMLLPASQEITTIFTEFGKFKYNHIPMGMCDLGDILQATVDELISGIKGTKHLSMIY